MSPHTSTPRPRNNQQVKELVPPEAIDWFCPSCGRYIGAVFGTGVVVIVHRCGAVAHLRFSVLNPDPRQEEARPLTT